MIQCEQYGRHNNSNVLHIICLKKMIDESSEESFFNKGIHKNDIRKYEQTVLPGQMLLVHEIVAYLIKINTVTEYQKDNDYAAVCPQHSEIQKSG